MDNLDTAQMTNDEYDKYLKDKINEEKIFEQQEKMREIIESKKQNNPNASFNKHKIFSQIQGSNITKRQEGEVDNDNIINGMLTIDVFSYFSNWWCFSSN